MSAAREEVPGDGPAGGGAGVAFEFGFGTVHDWPPGPTPCVLLHGSKNYLSHHREAWERLKGAENAEDAEGAARDRLRLSDQVLQDVRSVFARWLRMQNVVVLAGSGASRCAGGCVNDELLTAAKTMLQGRPSGPLLNALLASCVDNVDFEEFLSYLAAARRCLSPGHAAFEQPLELALPVCNGEAPATILTAADLDGLLLDIEAAIVVACTLGLPEWTPSGVPTADPHMAFVGKLLSRDASLNRVKLVTTNYDTLFEQAMDRLNVMYADGFTGRVESHFNPSSFGLDYYYPGTVTEGRVRRYDKFMHLYKIHGSVNWRKTAETPEDPFGVIWCGKAMPSQEDITANGGSLDDIFLGPCRGRAQCGVECDRPMNGVAILPTSAKYGESLAMPFAHLFRLFADTLQEPNTVLFVVGYGGWDRHVNRIIEDAMTNPSFTIAVVDPRLSEWTRRLLLSDRCERVYALLGSWGVFSRFATEVLPDVEQLDTQIKIATEQRQLRQTWPEPGGGQGVSK